MKWVVAVLAVVALFIAVNCFFVEWPSRAFAQQPSNSYLPTGPLVGDSTVQILPAGGAGTIAYSGAYTIHSNASALGVVQAVPCTDTSADTAILNSLIPASPTNFQTISFLPGQKCLVPTGGLAINTQYLSINGNASTLDCSGLASGTCVTFTGSSSTGPPGFYVQNPVEENSLILVGPGKTSSVTGAKIGTIDTNFRGFSVYNFGTCYSFDAANNFKNVMYSDEGFNCTTGISTGTDAPANAGELTEWFAGGIFNSTTAVVMNNTGSGFEFEFVGSHFDGMTGSILSLAQSANTTAEVILNGVHIEYTSSQPSTDAILLGGSNHFTWVRSIDTDYQFDQVGGLHSFFNASASGNAVIDGSWYPAGNNFSAGGATVIGASSANVTQVNTLP